jgi:hypothetical protein
MDVFYESPVIEIVSSAPERAKIGEENGGN